MFHDILHFQSLTCTDWDSTAFTGNVFCGFTASSVTGKDRSAKDGEWADFTGTSTVTVRERGSLIWDSSQPALCIMHVPAQRFW